MATLRKIWESFKGVDRRRLQYEIDMHRLYLLTSYYKRGGEDLENVTEISSRLSVEELQKGVQDYLHDQIVRITQSMDDILLLEPRPQKRNIDDQKDKPVKRPSGLSFAIGQDAPKIEDPSKLIPLKTRSISAADVSSALKKSLGYTLTLKPSQIDHKEAGQGVFLDGEVGPGTVVSFYPGIIYAPSQYRYMRGFPRMDIVNSYLVSRYDGLVIDGQSWGHGGESREFWNGSPTEESADFKEGENTGKKNAVKLWGSVFGAQETFCARQGSVLERRNPLALAHVINHPAKGTQPNVMLCPYDFVFSDPYMRPYIPNVHFDSENDREMRRHGLVWVYDKKEEKTEALAEVIRTLILVSTKEISNEELFLNYRLSNHKKWPNWYHPVDSEEDKRRWY